MKDVKSNLGKVEEKVKHLISKIVEIEEQKLRDHEKNISQIDLEITQIDQQITSIPSPNLEIQQKILSKYESNLGLVIEKITPYTLDFIFTHITPYDSENRLRLHLTEDGMYTVLDCIPPLPNISSIVSTLNSSKNISVFIRSLRHSFKGHYSTNL